jgi:hypothetical protein
MIAFQEWPFFAAGDPNGTRTRVFAVKGVLPFKSTVRPAFHGSFRSLFINDLQRRGDAAQGIEARQGGDVQQAPREAREPGPKDAPQPSSTVRGNLSGDGRC